MIWWIYNILFVVVYLALIPRFLWRMWRRGGYLPSFMERFGIYGKRVRKKLAAGKERFLIHAVSVGEIQVALQFMERLRAERPGPAFVLTTTTSTAHRITEQKIGEDDLLLYFPVDFPFIVSRVLHQLNPQALILVESELWPNLVRQMAARKKKIMLLNGRISTRSFRGYKLLKPFVRRMLENFSLLCAQSEDDAERLIELGAQPARVKITGSAKYDLAGVPADIGDAFFKKLSAIGFGREKLLLVGGSTWRGEETALLEIYGRLRQRFPALRLILVPRHAERRNEVKAEIAARGYHFELWSHIHKRKPGSSETEVLLVDTTGELKSFYYASDLVFIGKSLKARGGQNPIEAAVCAKPVITGPHMENFAGVITDFLEAQAIIQVDDEQSLAEALTALLADESRRRLLGEHAQQVVLKKSGALQTSLELFLRVLKSDE